MLFSGRAHPRAVTQEATFYFLPNKSAMSKVIRFAFNECFDGIRADIQQNI